MEGLVSKSLGYLRKSTIKATVLYDVKINKLLGLLYNLSYSDADNIDLRNIFKMNANNV